MAAKNAKYSFGLLQTPTDAENTSSCRKQSSSSTNMIGSSSGPDIGPRRPTCQSSFSTPALPSKTHNRKQTNLVQIHTPSSMCRGQRTPRVASASNTPYTNSSHVSNDSNPSSIIAIVEGRGQARGEIGLASLDLRQPVLILSQFSDEQTYSKTLSMLYHTNPLEILVPNTMSESSSNKLFSLLNDHFPAVTVSSVQRRYFNESKGAWMAQWLTSPPLDLQGPFCYGFEPRHQHPGLMESMKAKDHLVVDWLYTKTKPNLAYCNAC
ncbi:muts protein-like protein 4 [Plakobranchus ocellatus]|uniref:Muts protein-like protein 4 n=1 Tax=Plakobranchus ocellatus TaxID=259542 RepID=A0AAV4BHV9_9GAST|nr:muts protein-like protein 4 [Plakobranchus ocellatus]